MQRKPPDKWTVYGRTRHPQGWAGRAITREFEREETAWGYIVAKRLEYGVIDAVLVHTTSVEVPSFPHTRWRDRHKVLVRYGEGRGWWE